MIETLTVITISIIALILFRPGKTPPLENPLTINRLGQFHAVLAPRINLAQPLLEGISKCITEEMRQSGNTPPLYFSIQDKEVKSHGYDHYLLAATLRDSVLYFQATAPDAKQNDLDTIQSFSNLELAKHPESGTRTEYASASLLQAVHAAAEKRSASITRLSPNI